MTDSMILAIDTETTGLDPDRHRIWEVAAILYDPAARSIVSEHLWQLPLTEEELADADPDSLAICHFAERRRPEEELVDLAYFVAEFAELARGHHLVGAVPDFDSNRLARMFRRVADLDPTWHYHLIDVEALMVGFLAGTQRATASLVHHGDSGPLNYRVLAPLPWKSKELSRAVGVEPDDFGEAHTALADTRWALAVYRAVMGDG